MLKSGWSRLMGPQWARNEHVNYNDSTFHFKIQQVSICFHMAIHHVMVTYIYLFLCSLFNNIQSLITIQHSLMGQWKRNENAELVMANFKLLSWLLHTGNDKNVKNFNQNSKVTLMRFKLDTPKYKHHHFTAASFSSTSSYNYL